MLVCWLRPAGAPNPDVGRLEREREREREREERERERERGLTLVHPT